MYAKTKDNQEAVKVAHEKMLAAWARVDELISKNQVGEELDAEMEKWFSARDEHALALANEVLG